MTQAERRAAREVDRLCRTASRMPWRTGSWFLRQCLAEAERQYFLSGHPDDLALVRALSAVWDPEYARAGERARAADRAEKRQREVEL